MVDRRHPALSVVHQCKLLDISRSGLYYQPIVLLGKDEEGLTLMKLRSTVNIWQRHSTGPVR